MPSTTTSFLGTTDPAWTYSLTFVGVSDSKNTFLDWNLIAESPPTVPSPTPITNFISIPGHPKGGIDLSLEPWGKMMYSRITGSWNFVLVTTDKEQRRSKYDEIRRWLHGRTCLVYLMENSNRHYVGFFTVTGDHSGPNSFRISIGYNLEPVRYKNNGQKDASFVMSWTSQELGEPFSSIEGGSGSGSSGGIVWNDTLIPNVQELEGYLIYLNPNTGRLTYSGGADTDAQLTDNGHLLFATADTSGYDIDIDENGHGIQYEDTSILD